jgi:hypothetical protein
LGGVEKTNTYALYKGKPEIEIDEKEQIKNHE